MLLPAEDQLDLALESGDARHGGGALFRLRFLDLPVQTLLLELRAVVVLPGGHGAQTGHRPQAPLHLALDARRGAGVHVLVPGHGINVRAGLIPEIPES